MPTIHGGIADDEGMCAEIVLVSAIGKIFSSQSFFLVRKNSLFPSFLQKMIGQLWQLIPRSLSLRYYTAMYKLYSMLTDLLLKGYRI